MRYSRHYTVEAEARRILRTGLVPFTGQDPDDVDVLVNICVAVHSELERLHGHDFCVDPDGEFFTAPIFTAVKNWIHFCQPV